MLCCGWLNATPESIRLVVKRGSVLRIDLEALQRVEEQKQKKEQKLHAHVSKRDSVVTGVKLSCRAHQSDRRSHKIQEKPGGQSRARASVVLCVPLG